MKSRLLQIRTCPETKTKDAIQKAADFVQAFALGFDVEDAIVNRTRIVIAAHKIHILGSYQNIWTAGTAISNLILVRL
uniref:PNO1 second type I KH domain-containing protein n=1 Tax=Tetranychus urticae TaxID=32264 RepID=T1L3F5_TETUR